jgi:hypothetical protein
LVIFLVFSFFLFFANFLCCSHITALYLPCQRTRPHQDPQPTATTATTRGEDRTCRRRALSSLPTNTAALSLEGTPGPTADGDDDDDARRRQDMSTPRSILLSDRHGRPLPRGLTRPHNRRRRRRRRVARTGHVDTDMPPPRPVLAPARAASPCSSPAARRRAFVTACALSPCPSPLHAPRRRASRRCVHRVAVLLAPAYLLVRVSFFLFLLPSSFAVQSPCPNGTTVMWPRGRDDDGRSYGTTRRDDSHHDCNITRRDDRHRDTARGMTAATTTTRSAVTVTATITPHGATTATVPPL